MDQTSASLPKPATASAPARATPLTYAIYLGAVTSMVLGPTLVRLVALAILLALAAAHWDASRHARR